MLLSNSIFLYHMCRNTYCTYASLTHLVLALILRVPQQTPKEWRDEAWRWMIELISVNTGKNKEIHSTRRFSDFWVYLVLIIPHWREMLWRFQARLGACVTGLQAIRIQTSPIFNLLWIPLQQSMLKKKGLYLQFKLQAKIDSVFTLLNVIGFDTISRELPSYGERFLSGKIN